MAILIQSFLNSATKLSTTATTATTVAQLKTLVNAIEGVSTSVMAFYVINPSTTSTALVSGTLGSYGITTATTIYSSNIISTLAISSGTTLTKNINPPHSNTEIVAPFSAIWSLNYTGALGATNDVSYKLYVTQLGLGSAITLTSHQTGDFAVTAGNFLYDEYGNSIGIIKGNTTIDNYMAKAAAVCGSLSNTIINAATYKGTWNAFSDTPTLTDGVGTLGDAYDVTTSGTSGEYPEYLEQDWRIYDGSVWQRVAKTATTQWTVTPAAAGLADKAARQLAKLELAQLRKQAGGDTSSTFYRIRNVYNIDLLADKYISPTSTVGTTSTLVIGRPWVLDETVINVIEEGLVLNLDARNTNSWSREPGETTWYDLTSNNNDATVYGGIAYGEALGGALAFGGSDAEYAQCPPGVYFTSAGYTIQSWVYVISVPNWNRIIDFGSDAGSDNVLLSSTLGTNGMPALWVGPSGDTVQSSVELQANTGWHHVCATWNPTGNVGKVFIDGVLTGTGSVSAPAVGTRANCYIGKSNWGNPPDPNFNGGMGAIQIYSRTLSDAEITQNYNTTKAYYGL